MQAIHPYFLGPHLQLLNSTAHGQQAGLQDVERIYLFHRCLGYGPCQRVLPDFLRQMVAPLFAEFLGIRQPGYRPVFIQYHRSGIHRTSQGTAPGFVYAADD
jgi:hypothetical protein